MKLATINNGSRDGRLAVVSTNLSKGAFAGSISPTLLQAIEHWSDVEKPLRVLYDKLNNGTAEGSFDFNPAAAMAPLPRCHQWLDGSTFANHGALMERAFDMGITNEYEKYPLIYQGASDDFLGPCVDVPLPSESDNMDFEGEIAVVVDEIPMGTPKETHCAAYQTAHAGQRCEFAGPGAARNENRFRLGASQAVHEFFTRGGDARRIGRRLGRRASSFAVAHEAQRRVVRPPQRQGNDLQFFPPDRARRLFAPAARRHHRGIGNGIECVAQRRLRVHCRAASRSPPP
jgi:hypothetical protein